MNRRQPSSQARARRMNGSINLSMPNARAAALVRSLSEGTITVDDDDEHKVSSSSDDGDESDDSFSSLQDLIADSKPIAHVNVTLQFGSNDLTASAPTNKTMKNTKRTAAKRAILERRAKARSTFTASAADTPIPTCGGTSLTSCLSASSYSCNYENNMSLSSVNEGLGKRRDHVRQVSFSRVRIREYEVTCEDLTSSCPVIGLGWRYKPKETVYRLDDTKETADDFPSEDSLTKPMDELNLVADKIPSLDDT